MFTGIIEAVGTVERLNRAEGEMSATITTPAIADELRLGASVAVNGACLTVTSCGGGLFTVDIVPETLERSTLGTLGVGDRVNLERPLPVSGRLDGHIVQGHVDGVGSVLATNQEGARLVIEIPQALSRYVVEKGSVAIDGVSLTVVRIEERVMTIALVPHTLSQTTLGTAHPGDGVNIEVDVLAKYVERLTEVAR